jgi:dipeptidyl aminopeptidase/acylaminoacyl peptidase
MDSLHKKTPFGSVVVATRFWFAVLGLLAASSGWSTTPLEVYGHLPSLEQVSLSPDGTRLALIDTSGNNRLLAVLSLTDHKLLGKPELLGTLKMRSIEWADDDHLLLISSKTDAPRFLSGPQSEWDMLGVWDVVRQKLSSYPDLDKEDHHRIMNVLFDAPMVRRLDGHTVLFVPGLFLTDVTTPALFRVDLNTGSQRIVREGSIYTEGWLVNEAGEIVAEEDYNQSEQHWRILERTEGHLREIASGQAPIDIPRLLGFGPDPQTLLVSSKEAGEPVWRLLSLKDGTFGPSMDERGSLESPIEDRQTYRMIGGVHTDDTDHYVFFDPHVRALWNSIVEGFSGEQVEFVSASIDFGKILVKVNGPAHGFAYLLIDMKTFKVDLIGEVYKGLGTPLEVRRIDYKAADGLEIPAYLTLPRGKPAKNLPLIVFPHGGPAVRDTAEFDWWAQAMAAQGYLVLQPNYRGSTTDTDHLEAGYGQWGRKMQTDLSDGVRYLAKEGLADPTRVCIVGASYGGYAALAGVTLDPGIYRCAVSVAGISDLKRMLKDVNPYAKSARRYWERFMGVTGTSDPVLEQVSPIKHVDAITAPVMLIHGHDDTVVTFDQSSIMYNALKHAKKDVELVELKNEDHWLSRSETRLQMLQSSIAFLRAHNPLD